MLSFLGIRLLVHGFLGLKSLSSRNLAWKHGFPPFFFLGVTVNRLWLSILDFFHGLSSIIVCSSLLPQGILCSIKQHVFYRADLPGYHLAIYYNNCIQLLATKHSLTTKTCFRIFSLPLLFVSFLTASSTISPGAWEAPGYEWSGAPSNCIFFVALRKQFIFCAFQKK